MSVTPRYEIMQSKYINFLAVFLHRNWCSMQLGK